jgi:hypothetical protein
MDPIIGPLKPSITRPNTIPSSPLAWTLRLASGGKLEMSLQIGLFDPPPFADHEIFSDVQPHIVRNFWKFHRENPHFYDLIKRFALELKRAGRAHYGMVAISERVRWHIAVENKGDDFKFNNNYRSCYARLLMLLEPEFKDFFETRRTPGTVPRNSLQ